MGLLKRYYKVRANSLLESVVALSIISVCLYIAVMVYASVFTPKTSAKFYASQNKVYEAFFVQQLNQDSLTEQYSSSQWKIEGEDIGQGLSKIVVQYTDSIQAYPARSFYIANEY